MLPTLLMLFPGLCLSLLLIPKKRIYELIPFSLALGIGIFYLINIFLYQLTSINYTIITYIYTLISIISFSIIILRTRPDKEKIWGLFKEVISHPLLLFLATATYVLFTFWPPFGWDTITLHDFRAKLILDRVSFSQMLQLSKTDTYNPTYYLSYPPMVSFLHAFYYRMGSNPVIIDFFAHVFTVVCLFIMIRKENTGLAAVIVTPFALSPIFLNHINFGYTNLLYSYLFFSVIYLIDYLAKYKLSFKNIILLGLLGTSMKVTRWVEPFYMVPVFIGILLSYNKIITKIIYSLVVILIIFLLTYHWSTILSNTPSLFIESGISKNISLLSGGYSHIVQATILFWTKLLAYWPLLVAYLPLSVLLLLFNKSRVQKYLALNFVLTLGLMYFGSVLVFIQLPERLEIFDSINRLPMFLLPVIWTSLCLTLAVKYNNEFNN